MAKVLAVHVGEKYIRLLEGRTSASVPAVTAFAKGPTPPGAVIGGAVMQPRELADAITAMMQENGMNARAAVVLVDGVKNFFREITVPYARGSRLQRLVHNELAFQLGIGSEYLVQYEELEIIREGKEKILRLFASAMLADTVLGYYNLLRELGLSPRRLETCNAAIGRLLEHMPGFADATVVANFMDSSVQLQGLYDAGRLVFARNTAMRADPVRVRVGGPRTLYQAPEGEEGGPPPSTVPQTSAPIPAAKELFVPNAEQTADVSAGLFKIIELQRQRDRSRMVTQVLLCGDIEGDVLLSERLSASLGVSVGYLDEYHPGKLPQELHYMDFCHLIGALMA